MNIKEKWKRAIAFVLAVLLCFSGVFVSGPVGAKELAKPDKVQVAAEDKGFANASDENMNFSDGIDEDRNSGSALDGDRLSDDEFEGDSASGNGSDEDRNLENVSDGDTDSGSALDEDTDFGNTPDGDMDSDNAEEEEGITLVVEDDTFGQEESSMTEDEIQGTLTNHMDILRALEEGEMTTLSMFSARAAGEEVTLQVTYKAFYGYEKYGLGTWGTRKWEIIFEDPDTGEERIAYAYCAQPKKNRPGDCTATLSKLSENKLVSKVIWAGNSAYSGDYSFWNCARRYDWMDGDHWKCAYEYGWYDESESDGGAEWIITHIAASKVCGDKDWDYGTNSSARKIAQELIDFASDAKSGFEYPEISFSKTDVTAQAAEPGDWDDGGEEPYVLKEVKACRDLVKSGAYQKTPLIHVSGCFGNTITFTAPKNVYCFMVMDGCYYDTSYYEVLEDGRIKYTLLTDEDVCFIAPLNQTEEMSATFRFTARGRVSKVYTPYKLTISGPEDYQDLAMIMGTAVPAGDREASMTVRWISNGDLHIEKKDAQDGELLAGATFRLLDPEGNAVLPTGKNGITGDIQASGLITVRADGRADVKNIPAGSYFLREIEAPVGYRISSESSAVKITPGGKSDLTVPNGQVTAGIRIQKYDAETGKSDPQGGAAFENARFRIVALQDCKIGTTHYKSGDVVYRDLTLDRNGYAETSNQALTEGRFRLEETDAPTGYLVGGSVEFAITKADHGTLKDITNGAVKDLPVRGGVRIKKVDKDTKKAVPQGDASLAGAKFEIVSLNEKPVRMDGREYSRGQTVHTFTIGQDGTAQTDSRLLPYGTYLVREQEGGQPEGYLWNGENQREFSITQDNELLDLSGNPMEDPPIRGGVKIKKIDAETKKTTPQGNAALAGAEFEIVNLSQESVQVNGREYGRGQVVHILRIGEDGTAQTDPRLLPYGRYAVREKEGGQPLGYRWNEKNIREFSVEKDGVLVDLSDDPMEDAVIRGGVKVAKYDGEAAACHPLGMASLADMEIVIYNESRNEVCVSGQMYQPGEIVHVMHTDARGQVQTAAELLPYGSYRLVEVIPPEGYLGKDEDDRGIFERTFDIVQDGVIVDQSKWESGLVDYVKRGDLSIHKVDSDTQKSMAGVTFRIISMTTGETHEFMTDANGCYSTSSSYTPHTRNTNGGKIRDGIWFGLGPEGKNVKTDDALGALPYDIYRIEELPGENNQGMVMFSDIVTITENNQTIALGTIENKEIAIGTTAKDSLTGSHDQVAAEGACIVDTVYYQNLDKGVSYTLKGTLVNRDTGEAVKDAEGNPISAEKTFKPAIGTGSVDMEFVFDASGFTDMAVVVFEELYEGATKLAEHKDIEDEGQTIHYPEIGTRATDKQTSTNVSRAESEVTLVDTVSYKNLQVGRAYRLTGTLMVKETGEAYADADGRPVTAAKIFVPETPSGTVDVEFTFNGINAAGQTLVAFEELSRGGQTYAVHTDINDEGQSVYFPGIGTMARAESTREQVALAEAPFAMVDTVSYSNLKVGQEYRLVGTLMVKETGQGLMENGVPVTVEKIFVPDAPSGTVDMRFVFNAENLAGNRLVVFEELYIGNRLVASHRDLEDEGQTVYIPKIHTTALDGATKTHEAKAAADIVITDTVSYTNLIPGKTYRVIGILMDRETEKPVLIEGKEVTAEETFQPMGMNGTVDVAFHLNGASLGGKTVVVFESLQYQDMEIAMHRDIRDEKQSIKIVRPGTVKGTSVEKEVTDKIPPAEKQVVRKPSVVSGVSIRRAKAVRTGDDSHILFWSLMGISSLGVLGILLMKRKKG